MAVIVSDGLTPGFAETLEHEDAVTLLGEAERGDAPTEAGADDDPVVVLVFRVRRERRGLHGSP
jgi:hypothetical protein